MARSYAIVLMQSLRQHSSGPPGRSMTTIVMLLAEVLCRHHAGLKETLVCQLEITLGLSPYLILDALQCEGGLPDVEAKVRFNSCIQRAVELVHLWLVEVIQNHAKVLLLRKRNDGLPNAAVQQLAQ